MIKCTGCKKFVTESKFKNCLACRTYKAEKTKKYQKRLIEICDNMQCPECIELYAPHWICLHTHKRYRTLKQLGIKPIKNKGNQFTKRRRMINIMPIPREKFKIIIL